MTVSLYVHIPFCRSKCSYCDFFSIPYMEPVPDFYIENLLHEAEIRKNQFDITYWKTIYIGGGTPSLLSTGQIKKLLSGLAVICPVQQNAEITIEANPDDVTEDFLLGVADAGINRLSLGIQAMDDKPLAAVKRRCSRKTNLNALDLVQKHWLSAKRSFSVDCIAGLPEQTRESFEDGLKELARSGADHISLYTLTLEEGTPLYNAVSKNEIALSADFADDLWIWGREFLEQNGFLQYEVSNFAKHGFESRHNLTYWNLEDYVGIGSGATGTVGSFRYTNSCDLQKWAVLAGEEDETLSRQVLIFEYLMMGFRKMDGVSSSRFFERFEEDIKTFLEPVFSKWQQKGLACRENDCYYLNKNGILFLNAFLTQLLENR